MKKCHVSSYDSIAKIIYILKSMAKEMKERNKVDDIERNVYKWEQVQYIITKELYVWTLESWNWNYLHSNLKLYM